jgi:hypothetical protein
VALTTLTKLRSIFDIFWPTVSGFVADRCFAAKVKKELKKIAIAKIVMYVLVTIGALTLLAGLGYCVFCIVKQMRS